MSNALKIYPSGFAGSADLDMTEKPNLQDIARTLMSRQVQPKMQDRTGSVKVGELYKTLSHGQLPHNDWDFGQRTLKIALEVFEGCSGAAGWYDWVLLQHKYGDYTDYHRRWVNETVLFIETGKPRTVSHQAWMSLLSLSGTKAEHAFTHAVSDVARTTPDSASTLQHWLQRWCAAPGGIYDLAQSLHVLYGPR